MQYLLLARHGNTFEPGQKVVWVGPNNDLPLVETGIAQANSLSQALKDFSLSPAATYSSRLNRAITYAQIVHSELNLANNINIDNRLNEIDYGSWNELSEQEIKDLFGSHELDKWNTDGVWPKAFASSESMIASEVLSFVQDIIVNQPTKLITLAITSNGRMKYFLQLITNHDQNFSSQSKWKVQTGRVSLLSYDNFTWKLICWNEYPKTACSLLKTKFKDLAHNT